jgi:hypothetical protein
LSIIAIDHIIVIILSSSSLYHHHHYIIIIILAALSSLSSSFDLYHFTIIIILSSSSPSSSSPLFYLLSSPFLHFRANINALTGSLENEGVDQGGNVSSVGHNGSNNDGNNGSSSGRNTVSIPTRDEIRYNTVDMVNNVINNSNNDSHHNGTMAYRNSYRRNSNAGWFNNILRGGIETTSSLPPLSPLLSPLPPPLISLSPAPPLLSTASSSPPPRAPTSSPQSSHPLNFSLFNLIFPRLDSTVQNNGNQIRIPDQINENIRMLQDMFPTVPRERIRIELANSRSLEQAVDSILRY